jgi:hypothetical protein
MGLAQYYWWTGYELVRKLAGKLVHALKEHMRIITFCYFVRCRGEDNTLQVD